MSDSADAAGPSDAQGPMPAESGLFADPDGPAGGSPADDPEGQAREICLRLLTGAPKTRAQLAEALRRKNVPDEASERVLDRLGEVGLVDDVAFATEWVQSRHAGRGLARRALRSELRQRGVADDIAARALETIGHADERAAARDLVQRRLPSTRRLRRATRFRRLLGMLARKGYSAELAADVVREALQAEEVDVDDTDVAGAVADADEAEQLAPDPGETEVDESHSS